MAKTNPPMLEMAIAKMHGDAFLRTTEPHYRPLLAAVPKMRRFVFGPEASAFLGHFLRECDDLIVANWRFAIPPFENCYVEIDVETMHNAYGKATSADVYGLPKDVGVGYAFVGPRAYIVAQGDDRSNAMFSPVFVDLNTPQHSKMFLSRSVTREQVENMKLTYVFGSTLNQWCDWQATKNRGPGHQPKFFDPAVEAMVYEAMNGCNVGALYGDDQGLLETYKGGFGEVRLIWAALLLLNQHRVVRFSNVPPKRVMWKGKSVAYARHDVVHVNIADPVLMRKFYLTSDRGSPRRHEVRGHFAHFGLHGIRRNCEHAWRDVDGADRKWQCEQCGAKRVWRREHQRGDASKGFVTKSYAIDAKPPERI